MIKILYKTNYCSTRIYLNDVWIGTGRRNGYHYLGDLDIEAIHDIKCKLTLLKLGLFELKCLNNPEKDI